MKLKEYGQMEIGKIYHFDNMELRKEEDGTLLSHYPEHETMWYEFPADDKWFDLWKEMDLIEGPFKG